MEVKKYNPFVVMSKPKPKAKPKIKLEARFYINPLITITINTNNLSI